MEHSPRKDGSSSGSVASHVRWNKIPSWYGILQKISLYKNLCHIYHIIIILDCSLFNRTQHCLDIVLDGCSYAEYHEFIWGPKFPYLASLASLCNYQNAVNGEFI